MANYQTADQTKNSNSTTTDLKDLATDQFGKVADRIHDVAQVVAEQSHDAGERVQAVAGNIKHAVDKSVKDQPMATLAMAAVIGFVLGAVWKS